MTRSVLLPTGEAVPALGQGTWTMGERAGERAAEIASLRLGIELGLTLASAARVATGSSRSMASPCSLV